MKVASTMTRLSDDLEEVINTIKALDINRGSLEWKLFRDKAQNDLCFADRKGYSIHSNTGDKMGSFPANAKKSADFQADVWFAASREQAAIRFEGVDDAPKKTKTTIAEDEQTLAAIVDRLHNLNIDGTNSANSSTDAKRRITAAEVAKAAAALADAVAAAVAEAGYDSVSPAVCQDDQDYKWLCAQLDTPCWRASTLEDFTFDGRLPESGVSEAP